MTLNIKQKFLFHIISFISIRNKATNRFSIWKKISPQDSISLLEHGRTDAVWHLSRSFHALEHTEWTSLICIILTTSVAGHPVFRETRASSVHNSTNIGNCLANWNSSPPPVSPLAVTIRAGVESSLSYSHLGEILPLKLFHVESSLSTSSLSN